MSQEHAIQAWLESIGHRFPDRAAAGRALAALLMPYADDADALVLALPRGGVPVAFEVARALEAPLDLMLVRKLGVPGHEELAFGAIAEGGLRVFNADVLAEAGLADGLIERVTAAEAGELARRAAAYRGDRPPPALRGRAVILIDDGLATGATMRAAIASARARHAARVVVAVPVAARSTARELRPLVDDLVVAMTPDRFGALGFWYRDFSQVSDAEVRDLLAQSAARGDDERRSV